MKDFPGNLFYNRKEIFFWRNFRRMNWTYKRFDQKKIFQESPELVSEAARAFVESREGWQITNTTDGFETKGTSFSHSETAKFRIVPIDSGTKVTITLFVQRAGAFGFMLFDVGGFYNGQLRRWLENIEQNLHQKDSSVQSLSEKPKTGAASKFLIGCFGLIFAVFALCWLVQSVFAVIGIFTGSLYLLLSKNAHETTLHGIAARIVAGIILAFDSFVIFSIFRKRKKDRPERLYPNG